MSPQMAGVLAGTSDAAATGLVGLVSFCQDCEKHACPTSPVTPAYPHSATSTATTTNMLPLPLVPLLTELQTPIRALLVFMRLPKMLGNYLDDLFKFSGTPSPCIRDNMGRVFNSRGSNPPDQQAVGRFQENAVTLQTVFFPVELHPPSTVQG